MASEEPVPWDDLQLIVALLKGKGRTVQVFVTKNFGSWGNLGEHDDNKQTKNIEDQG